MILATITVLFLAGVAMALAGAATILVRHRLAQEDAKSGRGSPRRQRRRTLLAAIQIVCGVLVALDGLVRHWTSLGASFRPSPAEVAAGPRQAMDYRAQQTKPTTMSATLLKWFVPRPPADASRVQRLHVRRTGFVRQAPLAALVVVPIALFVPSGDRFAAIFGGAWLLALITISVAIRNARREERKRRAPP